MDGKVRITSEDGSLVGEVTVDGNDDVILEGSFKDIHILARGVITTVNNAQITNVTLKGEGSTLVVGETTRIENLDITGSKNTVEVSSHVNQAKTSPESTESNITVNKAGTIETMTVNNEGTTINGDGTVDKVYANANNIVVTTNKTLVIASGHAKGVMAGDKTVASGSFKITKDETTTSTNNTSSSSKSSSSSDPVTVSRINIVTAPVDTSGLSFDAEDVTVTLTSATDEVKIYYTVNGETPTSDATLYTEPFTVSNTGGINGESITIEAFETAIESNYVNTIKLGGDITGNITQTRAGSNNFTIDFDTYMLNGNLDITANNPVSITIEAGATVNNTTASGTATGTTITNNGTITNITADSDIGIENNNGDISVSGTGTVVTSGTASANVIGSTVVNTITDLAIDQEELRIGDITTANITTAISGDAYNVTSAKPSIVSVDEKTGLAITANA